MRNDSSGHSADPNVSNLSDGFGSVIAADLSSLSVCFLVSGLSANGLFQVHFSINLVSLVFSKLNILIEQFL